MDPGIAVKQHPCWVVSSDIAPCCGSSHSAIDVAIQIHKKHGPIALGEVDRFSIRIHPKRLGHTYNPRPASGLSGKFSTQFVVC